MPWRSIVPPRSTPSGVAVQVAAPSAALARRIVDRGGYPVDAKKVREIVGLYLNPPDNAMVFCVYEKSQIQALDRTQPMLPLRPVIMGDWYSGAGYGRIMGTQWSAAAVAGALGPWLVGIGKDAAGSYDRPMATVAVAMAASAVFTLMAARVVRPVPD